MYQKLRFSWGHIVAFLALIFLAYLTFMGITYYTNGSMLAGLLGTVISLVLLTACFIGPQFLKGMDEKFAKYIKWERGLLIAAPIIYIICMLPVLHFWTVNNVNDEFVASFQSAIGSSQQLFTDYEKYADNRIANLDTILTAKNASKTELEGLQLQLKGDNFSVLQKQATEWLLNASSGATTWNIFLMGNISEIKAAIQNWQDRLEEISKVTTSDEVDAKPFSGSVCVDKASASLMALDTYYTKYCAPTPIGLIVAVICFFMLALPYLIQERPNKSPFTLTTRKDYSMSSDAPSTSASSRRHKSEDNEEKRRDTNGYDSFTI